MVTTEEIIDLGFRPGMQYTKTDHEFVINNKVYVDETTWNPDIPWTELLIMYDFKNGDCGIYYSNSDKKKFKQKLWRGNLMTIEKLEEKLIELNGEY
jgi:hypothetical protein